MQVVFVKSVTIITRQGSTCMAKVEIWPFDIGLENAITRSSLSLIFEFDCKSIWAMYAK